MVTNRSFRNPPRYSRPKCRVESGSSIGLHCISDMRIEVHRCRDGAVTKPLLRHLWMDAAGQQRSCMAVSEIVEANTRSFGPAHQDTEFAGKCCWMLRLTVLATTYQGLT